jgi:hypothetical protein
MRTASQAVAKARQYTSYRTQYCLNFVQTMLGSPWSGPSAVWAWNNAKGKHGPDPSPPPGVPVWWLGSKYGHVAISVGGGRVRSTDWPSRGRVGETTITNLSRAWGRKYVGWAEYLGGQKIPGVTTSAPAPAKPAAKPAKGKYRTGTVYQRVCHEGVKDMDSVRNVQMRLIELGYKIPAGATGNWPRGGQTTAAVRAWQRKANPQAPAEWKSGKKLGYKQAQALFRGTGMTIKP